MLPTIDTLTGGTRMGSRLEGYADLIRQVVDWATRAEGVDRIEVEAFGVEDLHMRVSGPGPEGKPWDVSVMVSWAAYRNSKADRRWLAEQLAERLQADIEAHRRAARGGP